jgi:hypothetical protein
MAPTLLTAGLKRKTHSLRRSWKANPIRHEGWRAGRSLICAREVRPAHLETAAEQTG